MPKAKKEKQPKKPTLAVLSTLPEPSFQTAGPSRELCVKCNRGANPAVMATYVPHEYTKRLLVVFGTAPSKDEIELLRALTAEAGYSRSDVARISAVRCGSDEPTMTQIRCCRGYVLRAIDCLEPKLVIALGSNAAKSMTNLGTSSNVTKLRGRPLQIQGRETPAFVTYEPATVLAGGVQYSVRMLEDLCRVEETRLLYPSVDAFPVNVPAIAVDTEYAPNGDLLTVGVANDEVAVAAEVDDPDYNEVLACIYNARNQALLVGHSLSGDVDHLVHIGGARPEWIDGSRTWDSLLLSRMADENRGPGGYELESLLTSSHNVEPWKHHTKKYDPKDATTWPVELRRERCRLDAWASSVVAGETVLEVLSASQPVKLTHRIAMSLHRIELAGVYIDKPKLLEMETELQAEAARYKDQLTKLAQSHGMSSFSPTKDDDLRELLFKRLKLEPVKKTKQGKLSVDKTTLKQYEHVPEVALLQKFNAADKALSVNINGVKELVQDSGYMPLRINPLGAKTGRRSSGGEEQR